MHHLRTPPCAADFGAYAIEYSPHTRLATNPRRGGINLPDPFVCLSTLCSARSTSVPPLWKRGKYVLASREPRQAGPVPAGPLSADFRFSQHTFEKGSHQTARADMLLRPLFFIFFFCNLVTGCGQSSPWLTVMPGGLVSATAILSCCLSHSHTG